MPLIVLRPLMEAFFVHVLQTEFGNRSFEMPMALVQSYRFYPIFERLRHLIQANMAPTALPVYFRGQFVNSP